MQNKLSNLLIVGSVAFDTIQTPFGKLNKTLGGSASYFSLAARYFIKPSIVAVVGNDFPKKYGEVLKSAGVDISGLEKVPGKTFAWGGEYSFDLNSRESLFTKLGVFKNFKPELSDGQRNAKFVFLGNIHPALQLSVLKQIRKPKFVGLDTMNFWIEKTPGKLKKVLRLVDLLVINDSEARELSAQHNLTKAAAKILSLMKKNARLIIKRGENGLLMFGNKLVFSLPGYPLEDVADPTGAGDSFAGGFMGYLAKADDTSWPTLQKACVAGSTLASFCVEKLGTQGLLKIPQNKITERLKDFKKLTYF